MLLLLFFSRPLRLSRTIFVFYLRLLAFICGSDFFIRHPLDAPDLVKLFNWSEAEFLQQTEGSAIRRIGYDRWCRNIAVALGNAPASREIVQALKNKRDGASEMVVEHIDWALGKQTTS